MGFDYSFRWIAAFKALPDMLVGTWYTLQTTVLSISVHPRLSISPICMRDPAKFANEF